MRYWFAFLVVCLLSPFSAQASMDWTWHYAGAGVDASGHFTTGDIPDANGFYEVTAISGARNGVAVTGLQPTGTAIPGNAPFHVDNLVRIAGSQMTGEGFGFALQDGTFANPFYATFLPVPGYLEYFSAPPFVDGTVGGEDSELSIVFTASVVPEPASLAIVSCGLLTLAGLRNRGRGTRA